MWIILNVSSLIGLIVVLLFGQENKSQVTVNKLVWVGTVDGVLPEF